MKQIKALIFDMDGLLVDSEPIQFETSKLLFHRHGHQFTVRHLRKFLGVRLVDELTALKHYWKLSPGVSALQMERKDIFLKLVQQKLPLSEGAIELLHFLRKVSLPIGLGTSADRWFVDEVMEKFGIKHYFDVIVDADGVKQGKPNPEVYLRVAEQLKISPENCLVLEDAVNGVAAAKNAGMMCFAVPNLYTPKEYYQEANQIFQSLWEVTRALTPLLSSLPAQSGSG